ncbi:MAG: protein phosphatase 2C domain-containing protein [Anaerolineae bacterium]|nr:protein phosphatase 2C domain-containing protein [Anaerolineae bacterium]
MIQLDYAFLTDRGLKRQRNEDHCLVRIPDPDTPESRFGSLFLVADGIGSLGMGEVASQLATQTIEDWYYDGSNREQDETKRIVSALKIANQAVFDRSRDYELSHMGTTIAGIILTPTQDAVIFNVGDSRVYRIRGGSIELLSRDHATMSQEAGKTKLTAFIGQSAPFPPFNRRVKTKKGDVFVICSDGLWGLLEEKKILKVVQRHPAETAAEILLQMVYERGARDNVTMVIVRLGTDIGGRSLLPRLLLALVLIAALALGAFLLIREDESPTSATESGSEQLVGESQTGSGTPSPAAANSATPSPTADRNLTRTANAFVTSQAEATIIAGETISAEATANAQATASADARATGQAEATLGAIQAATVFSVRTQTAIAAATYLPATETQAVVVAATLVEEVTAQAATQLAFQIASQPPTPTLNPTLVTYTPTPAPSLTLTPTVTLTPSLTFTPSITFTPSATFTPTLAPEAVLELAEIGVALASDTTLHVISRNLLHPITRLTLPSATRIRFLDIRTANYVKVQVLDGPFAEQEGWIAESIVLESTPATAYVITTVTAGVRSGNGRGFPLITQLEPNTRLAILGISSVPEQWYFIKLPDGQEGWIAPSVVRLEGDTSLIPFITPPPPPSP